MSTEICWAEKIIEKGFDPEKADELVKSAIQDYSSRIGRAISPVKALDAPFIIAALRLAANAFAAEDSLAATAADELVRGFKAVPIRTMVPEDLSRDELEQVRDRIYGNKK